MSKIKNKREICLIKRMECLKIISAFSGKSTEEIIDSDNIYITCNLDELDSIEILMEIENVFSFEHFPVETTSQLLNQSFDDLMEFYEQYNSNPNLQLI